MNKTTTFLLISVLLCLSFASEARANAGERARLDQALLAEGVAFVRQATTGKAFVAGAGTRLSPSPETAGPALDAARHEAPTRRLSTGLRVHELSQSADGRLELVSFMAGPQPAAEWEREFDAEGTLPRLALSGRRLLLWDSTGFLQCVEADTGIDAPLPEGRLPHGRLVYVEGWRDAVLVGVRLSPAENSKTDVVLLGGESLPASTRASLKRVRDLDPFAIDGDRLWLAALSEREHRPVASVNLDTGDSREWALVEPERATDDRSGGGFNPFVAVGEFFMGVIEGFFWIISGGIEC